MEAGACYRVAFTAIDDALKIRLLSAIASHLAVHLVEQARVLSLVG